MKPRNKEDVKPFDLKLVHEGHPICLLCGDEAEIAYFDMEYPHEIGGRLMNCGRWQLAAWKADGKRYPTPENHSADLMLAPLGYCQGKPVFFGDVLVWEGGNITIDEKSLGHTFDDCTWPRKEPVMPKVKTEVREDRLSLMQAGLTHMLCNQVDEVIDYLVESGKVVRVQS